LLTKLQRVALATVGGLRSVLDRALVRDPRAKNYTPETFMVMRFIKRSEDRGFMDSLYPIFRPG